MKLVTRFLACLMLALWPELVLAQDGTLPFVIAFGSCNDQNREQPLWEPLAHMAPDVFVFLGDNVYADTDNEGQMRATYDLQNQIAGFGNFRKSVQIEGIWDDHDFGVNDGGAAFTGKDMAQRAMLDFLGEPDESSRRESPGIFASRSYELAGFNRSYVVQLLLLDTRYFKSAWNRSGSFTRRYDPDDNPELTLMGETQWQWLEGELRKEADLRIVASGLQVLNGYHGYEHWALFPHERERLFALIRTTRANGVILLSGDRHFAEISRRDDILAYPLHDFTSSGMTHSFEQGDQSVNPDRIAVYTGLNFGSLVINEGQVILRVHDQRGRAVETVKISLKNLQWKGR